MSCASPDMPQATAILFLAAATFVFVLSVIKAFRLSRQGLPRLFTNLIIIVALLYLGFSLYLIRNSFHCDSTTALNVVFVTSFLTFLQALRAYLNYLELRDLKGQSEGPRNSVGRNATDLLNVVSIFTGIQVSVIYSQIDSSASIFFKISGYLLCLYLVVSTIKNRLYDDLFVNKVYFGGSYFGGQSSHSATLLQGVLNVFLRAYFFVSFAFASIYALMMSGNYDTAGIFMVNKSNMSGNLLLDFFYYSVMTMIAGGYNDIVPISVLAKLLAILQLFFSSLFFGVIISLIVGRFGSAVAGGFTVNPTPKLPKKVRKTQKTTK